jgi:translation elongation factor EF-4
VNKIDVSTARPKEVSQQICRELGFVESDMLFVSAKTGQGIQDLLQAIIDRIPSYASSSHRLIMQTNRFTEKSVQGLALRW